MFKTIKQLIPTLLFVFFWWTFSLFNSTFLLPSPFLVGQKLILEFFYILPDLIATMIRIMITLFFAFLLGVPSGLLLGYFQDIFSSFEFMIDFLRSIPPVTLFPLFMLIFGIGESAKMFPIIFAGMFYMIINTSYGVRMVKKSLIESFTVLGLSKIKIFCKIILPSTLPYILVGLRITATINLILVIVFEMFVGTKYGVGQRIVKAQMVYDTVLMYALIVLSGLIGYSLNKLFLLYEQKKTHWWGK